jgi:hypothetical protein
VPAKADPFTERVMASVTGKVGTRIVGITDTTRDAVALAIATGYDDGLSPGQIADLIEGLPAFDEARAELVARTETMTAYNDAALTSYGEFGVTEVEAIDGDGDEECAARDGQPFSVEEAADIEDHPNGTLDWVPIVPEAKAVTGPDLSPVVRVLVESLAAEDAKGKAAVDQQMAALDALTERVTRALEAFANQPAPPAPQVTVNMPEQPVPVVNVAAADAPVVNVAAPVVNIAVPDVKVFQQPDLGKRVVYDRAGKIIAVEPIT